MYQVHMLYAMLQEKLSAPWMVECLLKRLMRPQGVHIEFLQCRSYAASTQPKLKKGLLGAAGARPHAALVQATLSCSGCCADPTLLAQNLSSPKASWALPERGRMRRSCRRH